VREKKREREKETKAQKNYIEAHCKKKEKSK
jgi:hypothetical protein